MDPLQETRMLMTRRHFFGLNATGIGTAALAQLLGKDLLADNTDKPMGAGQSGMGDSLGLPHFAPKAKRVIWLFQSGGPSQIELFDYKPALEKVRGTDLPESIRKGQRLTGMTSTQDHFPMVPSTFKFGQHGKSGTLISELLPQTAKIVDEICIIKSMHTEAINHDPAITFFQTGAQIAGRPSMGPGSLTGWAQRAKIFLRSW